MTPRQIGAVVLAVLLVLGVLSVVGFVKDPFGWRKGQLTEAKAQAVTATKQAETNQAGAVINDRRARNTQTAYSKSEEARRAIQTPDYDAALREYGAGIDRVREAGRSGLAEPDGERPGAG